MLKLTTYTLAVAVSVTIASAQQLNTKEFRPSGQYINKGIEYHDDGEYRMAIKQYDKVHPSDTNYRLAVYEKAYSYSRLKEYDKVLELCDEGLKLGSEYYTDLMLMKAHTFDDQGKHEDALAIYAEMEKRLPFSYLLKFNKGITYLRMEKYAEAETCFKEAIKLNPYHASSYNGLSIALLGRGWIAPSMMSLQLFLIIENDTERSTQRLGDLENMSLGVSDKEIEQNFSNNPYPTDFNFEEMDLLINNKVALDKKYKVKAVMSGAYSKQGNLIFEKMKTMSTINDPFYGDMMKELYLDIEKSGYRDLFINCLALPAANDKLVKWKQKNDAALKKLYALIVKHLNEFNKFQQVEYEGKQYNMVADFYENNALNSLTEYTGNKLNPRLSGLLIAFFQSGELEIKSQVNNNGNLEGPLTRYYRDGTLNAELNFADGKRSGTLRNYYENGVMQYEETYTGTDGNSKTGKGFYRTGILREEYTVKDGEIEGPYKSYYKNGRIYMDGTYQKGLLQGICTLYHPNGAIKTTGTALDDQYEGEVKEYYSNGQLKSVSNFKKGVVSGKYTEYYENGTLSREGQYSDKGEQTGIWKEYYPDGTPEMEEDFGDASKTSTFRLYDLDGILIMSGKYDNKKYRDYVVYDKEGKVIAEEKGQNNEIVSRTYYSSRKLKYTGKVIKTKKEGEFKDYYPNGELKTTENYKNGLLTGKYTTYFYNGDVKKVYNYVNDTLHGYYAEYYPNKKIKYEGYYYHGQQAGEFYQYFMDGGTEVKSYFINGELNGAYEELYINEKIQTRYMYDKGMLLSVELFDTNGVSISESKLENGNGKLTAFFPDGKIHYVRNYKGGSMEDTTIYYHPNGKIEYLARYVQGYRDGLVKWYYENGKLYKEVDYVAGDNTGMYKSYGETGKILFEGTYLNDDQYGKGTAYYENGKKYYTSQTFAGNKHGSSEYYSEDGYLSLIKNHQDGVLVSYTYQGTDKKNVPEIKLENGTGVVTGYFSNGKVSTEQHYENGHYNGSVKYYAYNGKLIEEEIFENGLMHGTSKYYYLSGNIKEEVSYLYDEMHGERKEYHENGKLKKVSNYYYGDLHGPVSYYDITGKPVKTYIYNTGVYIGEK